MQDGRQVGQTGQCTPHHLNLGALQIGVPPEVSCVESPQGLIDSTVHEE